MLSATPVNNRFNDLRNHLALAYEGDSRQSYQNNTIQQCNTKAWKNALKRAGIESFRWHDLRHTWASWHVQNGTSLQDLQQLGGWSSFDMVLRYAHLSSDHLRSAANKIGGMNITAYCA